MYLDSLLRGLGLILFCDSPLSGVLMLGGFALILPSLGLGALVGSAAAAASGFVLAREKDQRKSLGGLYSFNGALCGLAWPYLAPPPHLTFWLLVPVAALTTVVYRRLERFLLPKNLPVLSVPFVLVIWVCQGVLQPLGLLGLAPVYPHPLFSWWGETVTWPIWQAPLQYAQSLLPGAGLLAVGLLLYSPASLLVAVLGTSIGLAISLGAGGPYGLYWPQLYAFTTVPTALALGGTFVVLTRRSWTFALLGVLLSALVWWALDALLHPLGLFTLTAPFNIATLALLWVIGLRPFRAARVGIHWLPLSQVGRVRLSGDSGYPVIPPPEGAVPDEALLIQRAASLLHRSRRVVALTGAGLSTEAGIPDFASAGELWRRYGEGLFDERRLAEDESFRRAYWRANGDFYSLIQKAQPHAGHLALVRLEREGRLHAIITQHVDGLHQLSGNSPERVIELHGTQHRLRCLSCGKVIERGLLAEGPEVGRCSACGGILRVATVNYGESLVPQDLERAQLLIGESDLVLILGTALTVSPARELPFLAHEKGARVIVINLTETVADEIADVVIRGPAGKVLAKVLESEALYSREVAYRKAVREDYLPLLARVDEWYGAQVSYLLHPLFLEHFAETSWVAECEGRPVGFLVGFLSQDHHEQAYVHLVAVDPAMRRRGVARELYSRFEHAVWKAGRRLVRLIVVPENRAAIDFHRSLGFRPVEEGAVWMDGLPVMLNYGGPGINCIIFEKPLDQGAGKKS
ncbi:MAG: urea transporter [Nitrospinota bacterium]